ELRRIFPSLHHRREAQARQRAALKKEGNIALRQFLHKLQGRCMSAHDLVVQRMLEAITEYLSCIHQIVTKLPKNSPFQQLPHFAITTFQLEENHVRWIRVRRTVLKLAFLTLVGQTVFAQTDTGSLGGRVTDSQAGVIGGAQIQLRNQATGAVRSASTDESGLYTFTLIPPGRYDIEVVAPGFRTFRDTALPVGVALAAHLDIRLEVGGVSESVEVTDVVSMLNTESAAQGTVIGDEKIQSLPLNGRQFIDLALLSPNVTAGGRSVQQNQVRLNQQGGFSASGNRTNHNGFLLDGVSNLDTDYMSLSLPPILDTIAEFQVQTAQHSAEYGHAAGAQINVATKSGTNDWHGDLWEFARNRVFDSRPFNLPTELPKFQRNQFGGTAGGTLVKNKVFVFGGFERLSLRQAAANLTTVTVPTPLEREGDFSQSNTVI